MTVFQCWRNSILVNRYEIVCWYFHQHTEKFLSTQFTNKHLYNIILCRYKHNFFQEGFNYLTCKISKKLSFSWIFRKIQSSSASYIMNRRQLSAAYFLTLKFLIQISKILIGLRIRSRSPKMSWKEAVKTCFKIQKTN